MKKRYLVALLPAFALTVSACNVRQTEEGDLPEVEVEGGKLPEYDVDPALEMAKDTKTVVVPKVKVKTTRDTVRDTIR